MMTFLVRSLASLMLVLAGCAVVPRSEVTGPPPAEPPPAGASPTSEAPSPPEEPAASSPSPTSDVLPPAEHPPADASPTATDPPAAIAVDFRTEVQPILEAKCRPCHFEGGKMYGKLPFDRPETIRILGESLFTRIRDEESRSLIRAFLAQPEAGND